VLVTLVHNPDAGRANPFGRDDIVAALRQLGWSPRLVERDDLVEQTRDLGEAVVVAGGDGTVGAVAKRLAGTRIPVAIVPTGTVNNVARMLGVGVDPQSAVQSLGRCVRRQVDLGRVEDGRGRIEYFLEGFGVGLLAQVMAERATGAHKRVRPAVDLMAQELAGYAPEAMDVRVDGRATTGECLLVAAMNLRSLGPALGLAPDASCSDGRLDVALVRAEHREALLAHLRRAAVEGDVALPHFELHRGRRIEVRGRARWAHADDAARPFDGFADIRVLPRAITFLVPAPGDLREAPPAPAGR
jgi:diacylglycerol kinase family enzyme